MNAENQEAASGDPIQPAPSDLNSATSHELVDGLSAPSATRRKSRKSSQPITSKATAIAGSGDPGAFDPTLFRIHATSDAGQAGVQRRLLVVPIKKPSTQAFIRVHPTLLLECYLLELKEEREHYLVLPAIADSIPGEAHPAVLRLCVTRQGTVFLWPLKLPGDRPNAWHTSALHAAKEAEDQWVRVIADQTSGGYQLRVASVTQAEPVWPSEPFEQILAIAFANGKVIDQAGHPVLARLLGE